MCIGFRQHNLAADYHLGMSTNRKGLRAQLTADVRIDYICQHGKMCSNNFDNTLLYLMVLHVRAAAVSSQPFLHTMTAWSEAYM